MSKTDLTAPTPEECRDHARANDAGDVDPETYRVGQGFCVTTSKNNVAFLKPRLLHFVASWAGATVADGVGT